MKYCHLNKENRIYNGYPGRYSLIIGEKVKNPTAQGNTNHNDTNVVRQALSVIAFSRSSSSGNNNGYIQKINSYIFLLNSIKIVTIIAPINNKMNGTPLNHTSNGNLSF